MHFCFHVPRFMQPKNYIPISKTVHTDRRTDRHKSEYRGHPFRVSGNLPSTYPEGVNSGSRKARIHNQMGSSRALT